MIVNRIKILFERRSNFGTRKPSDKELIHPPKNRNQKRDLSFLALLLNKVKIWRN